VALAKLLDRRKLAQARARFQAWWQGEDLDPALAANDFGLEDELFDAPEPELSARLAALELLWGAGRIAPGEDSADALAPAQLGVSDGAEVAVIGPGLAAPLIAFAGACGARLSVLEWREETVARLGWSLARARLGGRSQTTRIDLEAHVFAPEAFDGVWSLDEFSFVDEPARLAHQIARTLRPDGCALIEFYAGLPNTAYAPAFASSFAEPQIRAAGDVAQFLSDQGLSVEAQDDLSGEHLDSARQAFTRLEGALRGGGGAPDLAVARELGWEAESWRVRIRLLSEGRLERRRIIARRPKG
jgi:SAM-dependent methyltransferase